MNTVGRRIKWLKPTKKFYSSSIENFIKFVDTDELSRIPADQIFTKTSQIFQDDSVKNHPKLKDYILKTLHKCAELKYIPALKVLGYLYSTGEHFGFQDLETAFHYYLEAAELNDSDSQYIIALMYIKGYDFNREEDILTKEERETVSELDEETNSFVYVDRKTKLKRKLEMKNEEEKIKPPGISEKTFKKKFIQNKRKGVEWLKKSSENGNSQSKLLLSSYYIDGGGGIEPNIFTAKQLLEESSSLGNVDAIFNLGNVYFTGLTGKIDGKLVEIPKDIPKALNYFHEAAYKGDSSSQFWLGYAYHQGNYLERDLEKSLVYLKSAMEQNHSGAIFYLALMYKNGDGVEKNNILFEELLKKSLELNNSDAHYLLGDFYYHGKEGREQNLQRAFEHYSISAEQGNSDALYCLGTMYFTGKGVKSNQRHAAELYEKAAINGSKGALAALADMFMKGVGVERDEKHAKHLLKILESTN